MQRIALSLILVLNLAAGLVLSAYASEQKLSQTECSAEQDQQVIEDNSEESFAESETSILTEIEEKEDINTLTVAEDDIESEETETEFGESTIAETETELVESIETETEELNETGTETETMDKTETQINIEYGTVNETEEAADSEITTENETGVETEKENTEGYEMETEKSAVYSVEFPSIDDFRFILDPYGLKGLTQRKSASLEELKSYAGKIYCNKKMMITNKSSVPIMVKVSIQLTGDINAKESAEELDLNSDNNVLMYIIPSENDLEGNIENYQQSNLGIVVKKDEPTVFEMILPESQYQWSESIEDDSMKCKIADGEKGHSVAFEIAGLINTKANWKRFDKTGKKIGLKISYSYEDISNQPAANSQIYRDFEILPYSGATVNVTELD